MGLTANVPSWTLHRFGFPDGSSTHCKEFQHLLSMRMNVDISHVSPGIVASFLVILDVHMITPADSVITGITMVNECLSTFETRLDAARTGLWSWNRSNGPDTRSRPRFPHCQEAWRIFDRGLSLEVVARFRLPGKGEMQARAESIPKACWNGQDRRFYHVKEQE